MHGKSINLAWGNHGVATRGVVEALSSISWEYETMLPELEAAKAEIPHVVDVLNSLSADEQKEFLETIKAMYRDAAVTNAYRHCCWDENHRFIWPGRSGTFWTGGSELPRGSE